MDREVNSVNSLFSRLKGLLVFWGVFVFLLGRGLMFVELKTDLKEFLWRIEMYFKIKPDIKYICTIQVFPEGNLVRKFK